LWTHINLFGFAIEHVHMQNAAAFRQLAFRSTFVMPLTSKPFLLATGKYAKTIFQRHPSTAYLTGLRGYAAFSVFLVHTAGFAGADWHLLGKLIEYGKFGVVVFFVLSGYLLGWGIFTAGDAFRFGPYLWRRLLRVYPLYGAVVIMTALAGYNGYFGVLTGLENDAWSVFMHLSFANLLDQRYQAVGNSVLWSVPVEIIWYLLMPAFCWSLLSLRRLPFILLLVLAVKISALYQPNTFPEALKGLGNLWEWQKYMPVYLGALIFARLEFALQKSAQYSRWREKIPAWLILVPISIIILNVFYKIAGNRDIILIGTILILVMIKPGNQITKILFENRFAIILGTISYPFYLLHPLVEDAIPTLGVSPVAAYIRWGLTLFLTLAVSLVAHVAVELPFQKLARYRPRHMATVGSS
jgi:peptidoglycan/LPS O-acetylase OafA/YrhL